jgi:putative transposase
MDAEWRTDVLNQTIAPNGTPEIFNTDQGSQFTSEIFIKVLNENNVKISVNGKGSAIDIIFVERPEWDAKVTVKYENIYLKEYKNGLDLQAELIDYFHFYKHSRFHESLGNLTLGYVYEN